MDLSVVVSTLNGRERLESVLDSLADVVPDAEVVVVNGPSTDGTSGLVRSHEAVDELIGVAERNPNVARNAGLAAADGDHLALLGEASTPTPTWRDGLAAAFADGAVAVTGPVRGDGRAPAGPETSTVRGRSVTFFDGDNVAFTRGAVEALDGFDEFLLDGGDRDAAHRLAGLGHEVAWRAAAAVRRDRPADSPLPADEEASVWGVKYRSLYYRLVKNYGLRPRVLASGLRPAVGDGVGALRDVLGGDVGASEWLGDGCDVFRNGLRGVRAGLRARRADRTPRRNPNGISSRMDRAVARYPS